MKILPIAGTKCFLPKWLHSKEIKQCMSMCPSKLLSHSSTTFSLLVSPIDIINYRPSCITNYNLVVNINGECKCRCRTTNSCPSGQEWDSSLCACVPIKDECTRLCPFPKILDSTRCACICRNSYPGGIPQNILTCECGPCLNSPGGNRNCISPIGQ